MLLTLQGWTLTKPSVATFPVVIPAVSTLNGARAIMAPMSSVISRAPEIRPATASDIEVVIRVWKDAGAHPTITDDCEGLARLLADAPGSLLVATDAGEVIGTIIAAWNGWRGGIYRIAVASSHRRMGLATTLLRHAIQRLESLGARRIDAFVVADDPLAGAFWDALSPEWSLDPLEKARYVRIG